MSEGNYSFAKNLPSRPAVPRAKQSTATKQKRKLTGLLQSDAKRSKVDTSGIKQKAPEISSKKV